MRKILYSFVFILAAGIIFSACQKDFLNNYPTDNVSSFGVTSSTGTAYAALNGIHRALYVRYGSQGRGGIGAWYYHNDEIAEDMVFNYATWTTYVRWIRRDATNSYNRNDWLMFYSWIANANVLINGIGDNTSGSQEDKDIIVGQSLIYRAWCHFYLVQTWGDRYVPGGGNTQLGVPLMLEATTEPQPRSTVVDVYSQINADLDQAILLMDGLSRVNKSNMNADVARGLKARVALTMGNYATAVTFAQAVIANTDYALMDFGTYFEGFRIGTEGNDEYIWASQIQEDQNDKWASYGAYVSRNFSSSSIRKNPRSISSLLYAQISTTDVRYLLWDPSGDHLNLPSGVEIVGHASRFPYTNQKFIAFSTADSRVDVPHMRISEMYLIVAEAEARLGNDGPAAAALQPLAFERDPSYVLSVNTGQALIDEIMIQRRIELWGEGFRFFDLKRLNQPLDRNGANHTGSIINNVWDIPAGDSRWTSLIPQAEMDANDLMEQNPL